MPSATTVCDGCDERVSFETVYDVEFRLCPNCGQRHKVTELGAHPVPDREERHARLREWDEEVSR